MPNKSLVQTAYEVLKQKYETDNKNKAPADRKSDPMPFFELLKTVGQEVGIESENELIDIASRFYTDITLDGRFIIKGDNTWVLRDFEKFDDIKKEANEVRAYDEQSDVDVDEKKDITSEDDDEENAKDNIDDEEEKELGEEEDGDSDYISDEDDYND